MAYELDGRKSHGTVGLITSEHGWLMQIPKWFDALNV
jgi:hypothetical protein